MSNIDKLIKELCPNGVEYHPLKEIANVSIGEFVRKDKQDDSYPYPVFNGGSTNTGYYSEYNNEGPKVLVSARGAAGFVNKIEGKYWAGNSCYSIGVKDEKIINWKYLYYYMKNNEKTLMEKQQKGGIPAVSKKQVEEFQIPVPPLEVQCEIVRILDTFTLHTAELTAELTARVKQYEYYRDYLIVTADNAEYKTLEQISTEMYRGAGIRKDEVTEVGTPCVRYGEIYSKYNVIFNTCISHTYEGKLKSKKYFEYGDVLFAITGENVKEIGKSIVYLGKDKCLAGGDIVVMKHNQNPKYIAYALTTVDAQLQKSKGKSKNKVVHTSIPSLKEISIPIPPLKVQEEIANILDKLYALTTDITSGLPAEIEGRQKQYEYYRDTLLNFKELDKK